MKSNCVIIVFALAFSTPVFSHQKEKNSTAGLVGMLKNTDTTEINSMIASVSIRMKRENPEKALDILHKACDLSRIMDYGSGISRALAGIGSVYGYKGDNQRSLEYAEESVEAARDLPTRLELVQALNLKGRSLTGLGRNKEAVEVYVYALDIAERIGAEEAMSSILNNAASSLFYLGRNADAIEHWNRALNIDEKTGDSSRICGTLMNIGNAQSTPELRIQYYRKALLLAESIGDRYITAFTLSQMSIPLVGSGRIEEAISDLERGLKIALEIGNEYLRCGLLLNLGSAYKVKLEAAQAFRCFQNALEIAVQLRAHAQIAVACAGLAATLNCDASKPTQLERAIYFARQAIDQLSGSEDVHAQMTVYQNLIGLHECRGELEYALEYHKRYNRLRDTVYSRESTAKIAELNARYETEKRESELRELQNNRRLQDVELERRTLEMQRAAEHTRLLSQSNRLQSLELENRARLLERNAAEKDRQEKSIALLSKDRELQASVAQREQGLRNSMLLGGGLLAALGFIAVTRSRQKKEKAVRRAETAEMQARAAEAQAALLQLEKERSEKELREEFTRKLISAQELERERIARELHDSVGQEAMVVKSNLHLALAEKPIPDVAKQTLEKALSIAATMLEDIRFIAYNLRPVQLARTGLTETIRETAAEMLQSSRIRAEVDLDDIDGALSGEMEIHIFRIVQEGLANVLRHAEADFCSLEIRRAAAGLYLRLRDDGRGFDMRAAGSRPRGLGLQGMRERVGILGGNCRIESEPGRGTSIEIFVPVEINRRP